jgi:hypothetical protein
MNAAIVDTDVVSVFPFNPVTHSENKDCSQEVNDLQRKCSTPIAGNPYPSFILVIENGRCAHGSGPMTKILARIHRIFGA